MGLIKNRLPEWRLYLTGLIVILLTWIFSYTSFYQWIEHKFLDFRFQYRKPIPVTNLITHIDIDNNSLQAIGRWPWSRTKHAELLEVLYDLGARAVVFDVDFFEHTNKTFPNQETIIDSVNTQLQPLYENPPDKNISAGQYNERVSEIGKGIYDDILRTSDVDAKFSGALKASKNVFLPIDFPKEQTDNPETASTDDFIIKYLPDQHNSIPHESNIKMPVIKNARGFGFVGVEPDEDGILRRASLFREYNQALYPQLALRTACDFLNIQPDKISITPGQFVEIIKDNKSIRIPIDQKGRVLINWAGNSDTQWEDVFEHIPYSFITEETLGNKEANPQLWETNMKKVALKIKGRICLVGMVATGTTDLKPVPVNTLLPGVMMHSNLINMMLTNNFIHRSGWMMNLLVLLLTGILITIIASRLNPLISSVATVSIIVIVLIVGFWVFSAHNIWVDLTAPALAGLVSFSSVTAYRTITEEKAKRRVKETFGRYVAPQVVNELLKHPDKLKLGGEKKVLTVFFSDMANFTNSTADLSPDQMVIFVNRYLSAMTPIIHKHHGLIDKYEGDAIMALFGAPIERPEHATLACWAALENLDKLSELNQSLKASGSPEIDIRIGINTGEMIVGNLGSESAMNYTVLGDEVILASRLEGINKFYQTRILISENTYNQASEGIEAREVDYIRAKGMKRPVRIYDVLGKKGAISQTHQDLIARYKLAIEAYRTMNWDKAISILVECLRIDKEDGPSMNLLRRCQSFKQIPPPQNWDMIYNLMTK